MRGSSSSKPSNPFQDLKYKKILQILCFFLFSIIIAFYCIILISMQTSLALDQYYGVIYNTTIKPQGEHEIQQIVAEVQNISETTEKLDTIAKWETSNFTEIYWEKRRGHDLSEKMLDPPLGRWIYDSKGKIRPLNIILENPFANDPAWIAYYRFGACGELAYLFADVANRSGYETRVVVAILKNPPGNHAWVEIKIGDEWQYYDPTIYGEYHH